MPIVSLVVKGKLGKTSKSLKILWNWLWFPGLCLWKVTIGLCLPRVYTRFRACVLVCFLCSCTCVLTCSAGFRALRACVLTSTRTYMLKMLACIMSLRAHLSYMLAIPKYFMCLRACVLVVLVCPIGFTFEKLYSKSSYTGKFAFIPRSI